MMMFWRELHRAGQMWSQATKTVTMGNDLDSKRSSLPTPHPLISSSIPLYCCISISICNFVLYLYFYFQLPGSSIPSQILQLTSYSGLGNLTTLYLPHALIHCEFRAFQTCPTHPPTQYWVEFGAQLPYQPQSGQDVAESPRHSVWCWFVEYFLICRVFVDL